jgi:hypothetical protein
MCRWEKITVYLKNKIAEGEEWIALIPGGGYWQEFVNKVMDIRMYVVSGMSTATIMQIYSLFW